MNLPEEPPRVHLDVFPSGDVVMKQENCRRMRKRMEIGKRREITALSPASAKRCLTIFRALSDRLSVMITLTYPEEYLGLLDGRVSKEHLHVFLKWLRAETSPDLVFAWCLEFQRNGNPHYHVLASHDIDWQKVAQKWFQIVGSGLEKHLHAGTRVESIRCKGGAADYVGRYLGKVKQKEVPEGFEKVGRFWGYTRGSVEVMKVTREYPDRESAKRDTRELRRGRKAKLREFGVKWKWKQNGFTDRSLGLPFVLKLIGRMKGRLV